MPTLLRAWRTKTFTTAATTEPMNTPKTTKTGTTTATPWRVKCDGDGAVYIMARDAGENEKIVATMQVVATAIAKTEMREANAELIVRAVNAHEELVGALLGFGAAHGYSSRVHAAEAAGGSGGVGESEG